jgi:ketosteroid isomerase-like protein
MSQYVDYIRIGLEAWNRRDLDLALSGMHPEVDWRIPSAAGGGLDLEERYHGPEGVKRFWELFWEAWEWISLEPQEFIELDGDRLLVLARFSGRGRGSGAEVERQVAHLYEFRDEKIIGFEFHWTKEEGLKAAGLAFRSAEP